MRRATGNFPQAKRILTIIRARGSYGQYWETNSSINAPPPFCSGWILVFMHPFLYRGVKLTFPGDMGRSLHSSVRERSWNAGNKHFATEILETGWKGQKIFKRCIKRTFLVFSVSRVGGPPFALKRVLLLPWTHSSIESSFSDTDWPLPRSGGCREKNYIVIVRVSFAPYSRERLGRNTSLMKRYHSPNWVSKKFFAAGLAVSPECVYCCETGILSKSFSLLAVWTYSRLHGSHFARAILCAESQFSL